MPNSELQEIWTQSLPIYNRILHFAIPVVCSLSRRFFIPFPSLPLFPLIALTALLLFYSLTSYRFFCVFSRKGHSLVTQNVLSASLLPLHFKLFFLFSASLFSSFISASLPSESAPWTDDIRSRSSGSYLLFLFLPLCLCQFQGYGIGRGEGWFSIKRKAPCFHRKAGWYF